MPLPSSSRRRFALSLLSVPLWSHAAPGGRRLSIVDTGAVADGATVNTRAIQAAIDRLAGQGGGTVVVPAGVFVSGALFLKPHVHLHLDKGAVLRCSTDMRHFPVQRTRIEGHFEDRFNPGLVNAFGCDGLSITGEGTLDGAGRPIWDRFWTLRNAAKDKGNFRNLDVPRARLAVIEDSRGVTVDGVTFKDSQFWNLHLYRCRDVAVRNAVFELPDDYRQAPSTDGIDIDSCQDVLVDGCRFSVTDDCIAAKGTKGPHALEDKDSPPTERIRVRNCVFRRGHALFTCGSEATVVRDVVVERCRVQDVGAIAHLKLRPDTPQRYEDIAFRDLVLESSKGEIVAIRPWSQYFDLKGEAPPRSIVRGLVLDGLRGRFGAFGIVAPNPGQTDIGGIVLRNINVQLTDERLHVKDAGKPVVDNVVVNGKPYVV
ncbi:glycosyl hydrolase family 28 protein [Massilia kyonggiensis]|nr:glycosyl hydrolase family 28 protein [Massilia kyonggiensis]